MKQIINFLEELPYPYSAKALKNATKLYEVVESPSKALEAAFVWENTPEGRAYWSDLFMTLSSQEPKPHKINKKKVVVLERSLSSYLKDKSMTTIELRTATGRDVLTLERELKQLELTGAISFKEDGKWHHNNKPKREYAID